MTAFLPTPMRAQEPGEPDTTAALPAVRPYVETDTANAGAGSVAAFEVRNASGEEARIALACFVDGSIAECSLAADFVTVPAGDAAQVMVRYTAGESGSGRVVLRASTAAGAATGTTDVQVVGDAGGSLSAAAFEMQALAAGGVDVWFLDDTVTADANMPDGIEFLMVKNTSTSPQNVSLSCTRTGAVTGCSVFPSSVYLDGREQIDVSVEFTTGAAGTGSIIALGGGDRDTLTVLVGSGTPGAPIVTSSALNPGKLNERSACVTSGAGPAGTFQCGELMVAHAMPAYRTMNRERSLTLLYNSGTAKPTPVIVADVSLGAQTMVPQSLSVTLYVNGMPRDTVTYSVSGFSPGGGARRIAIPFDATSDPTGIYPYSITVTNEYGGSSHSATATGEVIIVNHTANSWGAGWSLAGYEYLITTDGLSANGRLLVRGDGSAAYYSSLGANKWVAPVGEYRDTLYLGGISDPSGATAQHWRQLLDGTRIYYNTQGQQAWVKDRDGNLVEYGYASGRLSFIRISPHGQDKRYSFVYASGTLDYIKDPANRVLQATVVSGNLTQLRNPGAPAGKEIVFGYSSNRMTWRQSAEGDTTKYAYYTGTSLLKTTTLPTTAAGIGVITYTPVQSRGLALTTSGNATYASSSVTTEINGPRPTTEVTDVSLFWVNRYGAPIRVRDAALKNTYIRYHALNPLLVDSVYYSDGRAIRMSYDTWGRLTKSEDLTHSSGSAAVAHYRYNAPSAPESPDRVILPREAGTADTTLFTYTNGRLTQISDPRDHVTTYTYTTAGQVETETEQSVAYWAAGSQTSGSLVSRLYYNSLGNVDSMMTPMGHVTRYAYDAYGNTSVVGNAVGDTVAYYYTPMNLPDSILQYDAGGIKRRTAMTFDHNGNRKSLCDPRNICRSWSYDELGRVLSVTDEFGKSDLHTYDLAGNLTRYRNRQNDTIRTTFDAMNRPVTQHVGQVKVESAEASMYGELTGTVLVPSDTRSFQYDAMGRLQRAENNVAISWRDYTKEGLVSRDSQHVKISPVTRNTIWYTYHPGGARKTMQTAGRTFTYDYGAGGVLEDITWGSSEQVSFTYDGLSRRIGTTSVAPSGVTVATSEYRLDKDGRLYRLLTRRPGTGGNTLVDVEYTTRDALGRPVTVTDRSPVGNPNDIIIRSYAYDRRGQLIRQGLSSAASADHYSTHSYDASGNRLWQYAQCNPQYAVCKDTTQFVYWLNGQSPTNRLARRQSWVGGQGSYEDREYHYDHDGNNIVDIWSDPAWPNQQPIVLDRLYSADGKLQATRPTSATANLFFLYDALGRRQRGAHADSTNLFFYDGENTVKFGFASFLPGPGVDEPLVAFFGSGNNCPGGTSGNGYFTTSGNRLHDLYGNGTTYSSCIGQYNVWMAWGEHSGAILDSETFDLERSPGSNDGLSFFRNRFYDPKMGRFTQEDPIGFAGGLNLYAYAGNNPASYTDPFGLCPEDAGGDGATDRYDDCPAGTSGWYAHRLAMGQGNTALNFAGGVLTSLWEWSNENRCPECVQGVAPDISPRGGASIIFSGKKVTSSLANQLGIARRDLGKRIEAIKKASGFGGADNIRIDEFGNVLGRQGDEILGNVFDELPRK